MSYSTVATCSKDEAFIDRIAACASQEGYMMDPVTYAKSIVWQVGSKPDIEDAYAYALSVDNPNPGGDETVITDQMILSAVQPIMSPPSPEPSPPDATTKPV